MQYFFDLVRSRLVKKNKKSYFFSFSVDGSRFDSFRLIHEPIEVRVNFYLKMTDY
jgi:hypothetical protein